jgi:hypothetical protein
MDGDFFVESTGPNYDVSFSGDSFSGAEEFVAIGGETVQGYAETDAWFGPSITASAVPEPGTFTLLASLLAGAAIATAVSTVQRRRLILKRP